MTHYYAQISDANVVTSVSQLAGEVTAAHMIPLQSYDATLLGATYHPDTQTFTPATAPAAPALPVSITMRQARRALLAAGLLDDVAAAIAALPSPTKEAAQIDWEYSSRVERHNGLVASLGPALGLSEEQIDALFVAGAAL